jgi:hypothetical protein
VRLASEDVAERPVAARRRKRLPDRMTNDVAERPVPARRRKRLADRMTNDVAEGPVPARRRKRLADGVTDDVPDRPAVPERGRRLCGPVEGVPGAVWSGAARGIEARVIDACSRRLTQLCGIEPCVVHSGSSQKTGVALIGEVRFSSARASVHEA